MTYDRNVRDNPEVFALTVYGDVDAEGGYSFDAFVVWRNDAGDFLWAADDGCSCPEPFGDYHLANLPIGSARDALTDLIAWADDPECDYEWHGDAGPTKRRRAASALIAKLDAEVTR